MSITTRFISTSATPLVPNGNRMDPGAASQAARAAQQGAAEISKAFSGLAATIDQKTQQPDDLYAANAKANLEIDYNKEMMKASGQLKPNGNFGADSVSILQQMAQPYIENAPNDATRQHLMKQFASLGKQAQMRGDTLQFNFNEKHDIQGLADYAMKSASLSSLGQMGEEKVYANLEEQAAALVGKGYDTEKIQKVLSGAKNQVYLQSRLQEATTNPFEVLKAAQAGAYADKGPEVQKHIIDTANTVIRSNVGQMKKGVDKVLESIYAGRPADDSVGNILDQVQTLVAQTKDPELTAKYVELATAQKWDAQTRNLNIPELENELLQVQKNVALGNLSPDQGKKFEGVLKNKLDWAKKDGFAYYQLQNPTALVGELPTPNDSQEIAQQKIMSRSAAAAAASELQRMPVAPVTAAEMKSVFQNWDKLTFSQQQKQLNTFAAFGPEMIPSIAELAGNVVKDMGDKRAEALVPALNLMSVNPAAAMDILKGTEHLNKGTVQLTLDGATSQQIMNDAMGNLYVDDPAKRSQYMAAAKAVVANMVANDPNVVPAEVLPQVVKDLSGVVDVEQTRAWYKSSPDYKILPPEYGIKEKTMQNILDSITPEVLAMYSNGLPNIEDSKGNRVPLSKDDLENFQFVHVRGGQYKAVAGDATIMNDKNQPLLFDMRSYYRDNKATLKVE